MKEDDVEISLGINQQAQLVELCIRTTDEEMNISLTVPVAEKLVRVVSSAVERLKLKTPLN